MTIVVGTAGHIDHGKTTLLRALTGIDADRLPEERRRGMTIDVGYAHLDLGDGGRLDFVDVPGHDRLVGNMLVGAGEIDAVLLVVAADDGPRAQTLEHLELLDALDLRDGVAAITKSDLVTVDGGRLDDVERGLRELLARTSLAGIPIVPVSSVAGIGLDRLTAELVALRDRLDVPAGEPVREPRLAIDRVFQVRGRGTVVTGTLRGGRLSEGRQLRVQPGGRTVRIREIQVHGTRVAAVDGGGRAALNVAGVEADELRRGLVLAGDVTVMATDRLTVVVRPPARLGDEATRWPLPHGAAVRLHIGTDQVEARIRRGRRDALPLDDGSEVVGLSLDRPVAASIDDRFVLRWPSPPGTAGGGRVLDPTPPRGISRRRSDPASLARLVAASDPERRLVALVELHGVLPAARAAKGGAATPAGSPTIAGDVPRAFGGFLVAPGVRDAIAGEALELVRAHHEEQPSSAGLSLVELRPPLARSIRRRVTLDREDAQAVASAIVEELVATGRLAREGDRVRDPARSAGLPRALVDAMARLEASLAVPGPPLLGVAARVAGCPPEGIRALESEGRIVRVDTDLAWATATYRELEALALGLAASGPLSPAAFRDATGTSRKYSLALLEDLGRRGVLRRTPDGHVPGPRATRDA